MATRRTLAEITEIHLKEYAEKRAKREQRQLKQLTKQIANQKATDKANKAKAKAKANEKAKRKPSGRTRNVKTYSEEQKIKIAAIKKHTKENFVEFLQAKYNRQQERKDLLKFLQTSTKQRQEQNPDIFDSIRKGSRLFDSPEFCTEQLKKFLFKDGQPLCPYCKKETVIYTYQSRNIYK